MDAPLTRLLRTLRLKRMMSLAAWLLPCWLAVVMLVGSHAGRTPALVIAVAAVLGAAVLGWRALRSMDMRWLVRRLDALYASLQDSTALLTHDPARLGPLQRLQRARVGGQLRELDAQARTLAVPWRRIGLAWTALLLAGLLLWLRPLPPPGILVDDGIGRAAQQAPTATVSGWIAVDPPPYTARPAHRIDGLDATVEQGATLHWTLRLAAPARAVELYFHDGMVVPLEGRDQSWQGQAVRAEAGLYRVSLDDVIDELQPRYRIDVIVDQPPRIDVLQPQATLTLMDSGESSQLLDFRVSDDYGIGAVVLHITHAQGSGENVQFREQEIELAPVRSTHQEQSATADYNYQLSFEALGVEAGDDLVVRLSAADNREPQANVSRSASHILRWPAPRPIAMDSLDGALQPVLPAYFRSQRQIIMDTEQLISERDGLDADTWLARSDAVGVDQRILRLRYGQFLGEETDLGDHGPAHDEPDHAHDAHRDGAQALLEEFGHTHDDREAATLFDARTRETLRSGLNAMWEAERHLRSGDPQAGLPHEYAALENIKKVQEASRIYLERSGLETTPLDPGRRLGGERDDLQPRKQQLAPTEEGAADISAAWQALLANREPDWRTLEQWLENHADADVLTTLQAVDALRADPHCGACRQRLVAALWPLLPVPAAGLQVRPQAPAGGAQWLRALEDDPP